MPDGLSTLPLLVIEDDPDIRDSFGLLFKEEGYTVAFAPSLEEGLALVERKAFALVLTDLFGHRSADPLVPLAPLLTRAHPTPVGIVTGWPLSPELAQQRGFAFVIAKPFSLDDLLSQVAAALHPQLDASEQGRAAVVLRYFELLSARDWDGLAALCTDDVLYVLPGDSPYAIEVRGVQAFRDYTAMIFANFRDATFNRVMVYAMPKGLAARYQGRWSSPDGEQRQAGAVIFRFEGERIARIGVHLDADRLVALAGPPKL